MFTFTSVLSHIESIPLSAAWLLEEIAEKRGHQDLFTRQSPEQLKRLREYAMIESAVASNRIEGVVVDNERVGTVLFGNGIMRDRDEEEVRGYRNALDLIHTRSSHLSLSEETICRLHALSRPSIWDSGAFRQKECDIVQTYADGSSRVRFTAVKPEQIRDAMTKTIEAYENTISTGRIPPLIAVAAFNLDFLCIHPFRDGNGRVSRLLLLLMLCKLGYEVGHYVSMERLIELSKDRYYETLESSSVGWHDGKHDPWFYINYLLYTINECYSRFEERFAALVTKKGEKSANVIAVLNGIEGEFTIREIEWKCPGVSRETIRFVMKKNSSCFSCNGHGISARWTRIKPIPSDNATV